MRKAGAAGVLLAAVAAVVLCAGCSSTKKTQQDKTITEGLDRLGEIHVIAREDGSGTRSVFAGLLGFDEVNKENQASDLTRTDAEIVEAAGAVTEGVRQSENAIGYVSMGSLEEAEGVKTLKIEEIELSAETVEKGSYPLTRSFYVAYYAKSNDLQQEFLAFIKGKGQDIVAENYIPVGKSSTFLSLRPSGTLTISGSTSVAPLMEMIAEEYMIQNPSAELEITESDSSQGLNAAIKGEVNFAMSSRELKDYEKELLDYDIIAKEGIAVIVNENNPLESITMDQLRAIYTGGVSHWEELNQQ